MAASLFDSAIYRDLVTDRETAALFSDSAEVRAMLIVLGALARAQGAAGVIPEISAGAIHRASMELQIDPGGLARATGRDAVAVPELARQFRDLMQAPEHAQWVHFGATSQDIMDTALALRLRQVLARAEDRLAALMLALARQAEAHATLPMAGRTFGQAATPTSFGAVAAGWGGALPALADRLDALRPLLLTTQLAGSAGTLSAMAPETAQAVRAGFADALGLGPARQGGHAVRQPLAALASWATEVTGSLAKMGADLMLMTQTGIAEVRLPASGGSAAMPQKQNPVMPSLLGALAAQTAGLNGVMQAALVHRQQRDGAAWISEWLSLPQICMGLVRSLDVAADLARDLAPLPVRMAANIDDGTGGIFAEALQVRLGETMPPTEAQAQVKALCARMRAEGRGLPDLAREAFPEADLDGLFSPAAQLGLAPADARAFAASARERAEAMTRVA
ncbi:lyase family protein [Roseisalinus antarcticus]|uniref:3-carboxy-cis,cis-muconate cycloisomerase n=1 Tax=Roseisalinus antarcticus TaxID=254357 RepID=A0A1Y5T132_9RHOB|nr:lyase family protein [Roseisalinus antarcticus]SLN49646.1 3-carboxy-cis,cis-muconate cycloisomerase [Roseisalinus antarcticus]